ncbi:hypothetical protein SAMN05421749_10394 [Acinetobacter marinus]|uniref:Uncharacterized protein n=1 Tax=Acinetobacter marinus TaxID=281375 RepID=A0A1G6IPC6_9GAMM|nr:hypothetical protein [Acinetobacter marinus]SDC07855.1 hypothetical protein SAMN05421749_10394 [Acinetobacter marinus]
MKKIVCTTVAMMSLGFWTTLAVAQTADTEVAQAQNNEQITNEEAQELVAAANSSKINIQTRPEIMGLWGMEIPDNKRCVEYYNFSGENNMVIKSDQEWSIGQYQYQAPSNRSEYLPTLIFQIKYDNNQTDCSGVKQDQTGEIQQFFVKWVNPTQIQFCGNQRGEQCFATLNKQLP